MTSSILGSAPSSSSTTASSIDPDQQALLGQLGNILSGDGTLSSTSNFGQVQPQLSGTQYAAPLSTLQTSSLSGMENLINSLTSSPNTAATTSALGAGTNALTGILSSPPVSQINATQAFNQGVVQPETQAFDQYTIPAINGRYGESAGGGVSSDSLGARQQAGTSLAQTLAQQGSQYSLSAAEANQAAQGTNAQLQTAAATDLPQLLATPLALDTAQQSLLTSGLAGGAVPQSTAQTQISGEEGDYQSMLTQLQQQIADLMGTSTANTQTTNTVVQPGQTGLLSSLLGGASTALTANALSSGGSSGLAALLAGL